MVEEIKLEEDQKVAVLLASLDQQIAASILQQLEPKTMTRVAEAIRQLGVVSGEVRDRALSDCIKGIVQMGDVVQGDDKTVNALLSKAIGEKRATSLLQDKTVIVRDAFSGLSRVPVDQIAGILAKEQAGVVSVVLRHLSSERAAEVMSLLSSDLRKQAVVCMCRPKPPSAAVVAQIDEFIRQRTEQSDGATEQASADDDDKLDAVADLLQQVDKAIEEELLTAIDDSSEEIGSELRDRLFTFEDIVNINDAAIRRILQEIDMSILSVALRGASIDTHQKIFKNMSKRAAESIKEEMEYSQKIKMSEIKEKQKEIVNTIRALEVDGQITISDGGEDEYV